MKRAMRFALIVCTMTASLNLVRAQSITIDSNDVKAWFAVGTRITSYQDTLTASLDIGSTGSPVLWDFSGLQINGTQTRKSVPVQSTLYAAGFPQATHALVDTAFVLRLNTGILGWANLFSTEAYLYYRIDGNLFYCGIQGSGTGYLDISPVTPIPFTAKWYSVPPIVEYSLPLEPGRTWTYNYLDSLAATATLLGGTQMLNMADLYSVTCTVDAYGSLTLPGGEALDALRIRRVATKNGSLVEGSYIFVAKNGATVQVYAADPSALTGTIAVTDIVWTEGLGDAMVPIELASFSATAWDGNAVKLQWSTLSETNNFGFFIQRKIRPDAEFRDLQGSFVAGHGTTVVPQHYSYLDAEESIGARWYRLKQVDLDGTVHYSEAIRTESATGIRETEPATWNLEQNYPNPFNPATTIGFSMTDPGFVTLKVFDLLGRELAVLVHEQKGAGRHEVMFDASGAPSGMYVYRMQVRPLASTAGSSAGRGAGVAAQTRTLHIVK
ncbi:MAG: T9SS type A sorting domain-containing protein [Bacteroidetes bacterium]|nr:T9SS type A sorting domain-containing protein [Bacteroidota bacterium]